MSLAMTMSVVGAIVAMAQPQTIRIWGPQAMAGIAARWASAYSRDHPNTSFELTMKGSDTAVPGLYAGRADIAFMGRQNDGVDDNGFSRPLGYPLTRLAITSGSLTVEGKSDAVAVLVPNANPISGMTIGDLGRLLDCGTGAKRAPIRSWGQLGLRGRWAAKPVHIYVYDLSSRTGVFIQHVATSDRRRMCWGRIREYADARNLDGTTLSAADRIGRAARLDPDGLAIASVRQAIEGLKLVALSKGRPSLPVLPTVGSVADGTYPLARRTYAFIRHKPKSAVDPKLVLFLDFVLSRAGQSLLAEDRGYLPLDPTDLAASRAVLESAR